MTVPEKDSQLLLIENLIVQYGDNAIAFPNWQVLRGQHSLIIGPSGSGKTTLLHVLAGVKQFSQGRVEVAGSDISNLSVKQRDAFRRAHVGIVFQQPHLVQSLTLVENLQLALTLSRNRRPTIDLTEMLEELGLQDVRNRRPSQVSQGQAQRAAIARALIHRPTVLFADEPTASLDDTNCERVIHILMKEAEQSTATLIISTHDQRVKSTIPNQLHL